MRVLLLRLLELVALNVTEGGEREGVIETLRECHGMESRQLKESEGKVDRQKASQEEREGEEKIEEKKRKTSEEEGR